MKIVKGLALTLVLAITIQANSQDMERKKANITASHQILINAPIAKVWEALAVDYGGIGKWASGVNHVIESSGEGANAKRFCSISASGFNDTKEQMLKFEPENYYFEYELYEGLPGFVKYSINKDQLEDKNGKTLWTSTNEMRVGGFMGLTMKWMMRKQLTKVLEGKAEELKHFIETGQPHPTKVEVMQKKAKKDAKMLKKVAFVEIEQIIDAPAEKVWQVIGDGFADVSKSHPDCPSSEWVKGYGKSQVGAKRIMYMTDRKDKKYFVDKIAKYQPENHHITIEISEKKGFGNLNIDYTWVNMDAIKIDENKTRLKIRFNYLTKPRFLKGLAKGSLKKAFQRYAFGIDHYVETGEEVTKENWKTIKKKYR